MREFRRGVEQSFIITTISRCLVMISARHYVALLPPNRALLATSDQRVHASMRRVTSCLKKIYRALRKRIEEKEKRSQYIERKYLLACQCKPERHAILPDYFIAPLYRSITRSKDLHLRHILSRITTEELRARSAYHSQANVKPPGVRHIRPRECFV